MNPTQKQPTGFDLSPAEVLRCAAIYVQRHGLYQGDMFADPTRITSAACTQGAVKMAICGTPNTDYTRDQAALFDHTMTVLAGRLDTLFYVWGINSHGDPADAAEIVADWNDQTGRIPAEVVTVMNGAADEWDLFHGFMAARDCVSGGAE